MSLPGSGLISASCIAYRKTNGVPMPGVSAGSRNAGANTAWKATVGCPSGWVCAPADPYHPARRKKETRTIPRVSARISDLLNLLWVRLGRRGPRPATVCGAHFHTVVRCLLRGLPLVGGRLGSPGAVAHLPL